MVVVIGCLFLKQDVLTILCFKINLSPLFQPSIGVRPMPTERTQHSVMTLFALCPVTRLLYLKGGAEHNHTSVVLSMLRVIVSPCGKVI